MGPKRARAAHKHDKQIDPRHLPGQWPAASGLRLGRDSTEPAGLAKRARRPDEGTGDGSAGQRRPERP